MKTQKSIAATMILASSLLIAYVSRDIAYPTILCMLGLLGLQRRFTWQIKPERRIITSLLLLLLAIMFSMHYRYAGLAWRVSYAPAGAAAWQTIARYFLASMILVLFLGRPNRLPPSLGLFHLAATISAGQVFLLDDRYVIYRLAELTAVILLVFYAISAGESDSHTVLRAPGRRARWPAAAIILLVTANVGWAMGSLLYRHVEVLNYLPMWFWRADTSRGGSATGISHIGFSDSGRLSNILMIKDDEDPTPVLTITSDRTPGYLRARAFDQYRQSEWQDLSTTEPIFAEHSRTLGMRLATRTNTFRIQSRIAPDPQDMVIRHEVNFGNTIFTPLGVLTLEAPLGHVMRDDDDILYPGNRRAGLDYRIVYSKQPYRRAPGSRYRRMLDVPPDLDPRIRQMADRIFEGCTTTSQKIDAVVDYFRTNYSYSLSMSIAPGRDKLTAFLLEKSSGYCEYFASGSAILLRLAGVSTRYVTGFFVTERDPGSGSWIAINANAHAWAEAWDQELNQWTVVEATVQEQLAEDTGDNLAASGEDTGPFFAQFVQAVYQYGLFGAVAWLFQYYSLAAGLITSVIFAACAVLLAIYRSRRNRAEGAAGRAGAANATVAAMHRMLARMDRKVKAAGHTRVPAETLHAFSVRIRAHNGGDDFWTHTADWYRQYAGLRYARRITAEEMQHLRRLADKMRDRM